MRRSILALAAALALTAAPAAALAAPTCQDRNGDTIRCGVAGAMQVGWSLPADQRPDHDTWAALEPGTLFGLVAVLGGLFALIGLMPAFDGRNAADWDRQEGDDERE